MSGVNPEAFGLADLRRKLERNGKGGWVGPAAVVGGPTGVAEGVDDALGHRIGVRTIAQRLESKFGLGECPKKRQKLYRRVEAAAKAAPELVERIVSEVVAEAVSAKRPARYFCFSVVRRLREGGALVPEGGDASW